MAIVAMQGRSDARGTAWVLASATLDSLRDIPTASQRKVEINNTYRLLEAFSGSAYFSAPELSLYPNMGRDPAISRPGGQENISSVASAIQSALSKAFDGVDEKRAVECINDVLVALYRGEIGHEQKDNVARSMRFFELMKSNLGPSR